jgi:hypothetical protein
VWFVLIGGRSSPPAPDEAHLQESCKLEKLPLVREHESFACVAVFIVHVTTVAINRSILEPVLKVGSLGPTLLEISLTLNLPLWSN